MNSGELKPYQLVEFVHEKQADGKKMIDCVPSKWINWDAKHASLVTKFMPPPYVALRCKTLKYLIESNAEAPTDWPTYPIALNGDAKTYDIGQDRLNKLRVEEYAYSTDCDQNGEERANDTLRFIKEAEIKDKPDEKLWDVPTLKGDGVQVLESSYTESSESDSVEVGSEDSISAACKIQEKEPAIEKKLSKSTRTLLKKTPQKKRNSNSPKRKNKISNRVIGFKTAKPMKKMQRSPRLTMSKSQNELTEYHDEDASTMTVPMKKTELIANRNERRQDSRLHTEDSSTITQSNAFKSTEESRQFRAILADLESIKTDIKNVHREVQNLRSNIETLGYNITSEKSLKTFAEQHDVTLPIDDLDLFQKFLEKLEDPDFQKAFIASLDILIDPEQSITKGVSAIIRKHISRELAMHCTAVKPSGDKLVLKSTQFCKCILRAFELKNQDAKMKSPCTEKKILKVLGSVLGNSKDWDGHRLHRGKNN